MGKTTGPAACSQTVGESVAGEHDRAKRPGDKSLRARFGPSRQQGLSTVS